MIDLVPIGTGQIELVSIIQNGPHLQDILFTSLASI